MPSPSYLRKQADLCLRLALASTNDDEVKRLIAMAERYQALCSLHDDDRMEARAPKESGAGSVGPKGASGQTV